MEYVTSSGLRVVDRRSHERALPDPSAFAPRDHEANDNGPGPNDPPTSVGPTSSEGFGNTHVMYPADRPPAQAGMWDGWPVMSGWSAEPWSGWPAGWNTPPMTPFGEGGGWGGPSKGDPKRTYDLIFAAIGLNAGILSAMPPYLAKGNQRLRSLPWMADPEPLVYPEGWPAFVQEAYWCKEAVGEVFIYATARYAASNGGRPQRFMVVNPSIVHIKQIGGRRLYRLGATWETGVDVTEDMLHVRHTSWPGKLHGRGPLDVAGNRTAQALALMGYATGLMRNGGIPEVVIESDERLTTAQMRTVQDAWVTARLRRLGAPAVLSGGAKVNFPGSSPKDMAMSELADRADARLAVVLGVPPALMALPQGDPMTYASTNMLTDFHWRAYLRPRASKFMAALSKWLLPDGSTIEVNRDDYTRPTQFEMAQTYAIYIDKGVVTAEEVRQIERFDSMFGAIDVTGATQVGDPEVTDLDAELVKVLEGEQAW